MGWGIPLDIYANFNRLAGDTVKFWIDTDANVVLDGSNVTAMADQSNASNSASQVASARQPTLEVFNSENVVRFQSPRYLEADGVSSVFNANDVPYTIFNLCLPVALTGPTLKSLCGSGLVGSVNSYFIGGYDNAGIRRDLRNDGVTQSVADGIVDITDGGMEPDLVLLTERCDGTNVAFWRNGISDTGAGVPGSFTNPLNAQDLYTIGALRRAAMAATNQCNARLKIQVVCDRELNDPERIWVQNAIAERRFSWSQ